MLAIRKLVSDNRGFIAFLLVFGLIRTAVADYNPIPSGSMHPNILEGDVVAMRNNQLVINGQPVPYQALGLTPEAEGVLALRVSETLAGKPHDIQWLQRHASAASFAPVQIPADQFLMLGDNRDNSADSRYIGLIPRDLLIGRASRILVSANITGNWMPRFDRFGKSLYN